ncbi:hypothetical protein OPQ81_011991 [Rhizoctonia solani]|nr:hypothetical protein OPQ81_011991 [Rhizoctonia solani]
MDRRCIDLYVRALSFLGSSPTSQDTVPRSSINEVEVMIWDLQSGIENEAASLIIDGNFMPDNHNLLALRIGSMAASQGLQRLNGQADDTMVKITHLFEQHLAGVHELHSAALVSLVNAATLLSICTPCGTETVSLASLCMQLFDKNIYWLNIEPKYGITLAMCALLQNKHADRRSSAGQVDTRWVHSAMHILLESQGPRKESPGKLAWFATAEVLSNPQAYGIEFSHVPKLRNLLNSAVKSITSIWMAIPEDHHTSLNETLIEPHLDNLQRIYILSRVGAPVAEVYAFVLESMCRDSSVRTRELCGNLMSRFRFPTLSTEMVECMARRNLIKTLANAIHHKSGIIKLFAVSQMWIFYTLYIDCYTSCETDRDELLDLLKTYCPREGQEIGQVRACLGQEVELGCRSLESELGSLRVYVYRVLEHVLFVRDCPSYDSEWKKIQATLVDVPYPLRGPRRSSDSPHPACR